MRLWDHTAIDALERCEEEFVQRYVLNRAPPIPDPSPLFGQAIHAGVRALYDGVPTRDAAEMAAIVWRGVVAGLGDAAPAFAARKPHFTPEYAGAIVTMYPQAIPIPQAGAGLLMNERYLEWPEAGICGIVDRVIEHADGRIFVHDLKTTGLYVGDKWARQWAHNLQTGSFYLDLAEHEINRAEAEVSAHAEGSAAVAQGGVDAHTVQALARRALVPDARRAVVDGVWIDAVHVDRRGYPKIEDFHSFGPFTYSLSQRHELRLVRERHIERAEHLTSHPDDAGKETRSCFRFNELCQLLPFCMTPPESREARYQMALESGELVERAWEPGKERK